MDPIRASARWPIQPPSPHHFRTMPPQTGDSALFIDRDGEEHRAMIQDQRKGENVSLVYVEGEEEEAVSASNLRLAINIPIEDDAHHKPYYRHRPDENWLDDLL